MTLAPLPSCSFCLVRHGETTANADDIIAGVTDVSLTHLGRDQARALAVKTWPKPTSIHVSPLVRARDSAQLAFPNREFDIHDGLRERDWGVFEGQPLSAQPARAATPDQGESWPDMLLRVQNTITLICATSDGTLPVLVCHSGIIRAARVLWTTGDVGPRPPNAIPLLFERNGNTILEKTL
ncbi:putative phosphoglycerate mutase [Pacificibacter maritimus]|uniref:Putative phosphoglycerate mutase n=1 Tax=Pacificibacter maritimus TaxID=762213 RepID=A0A3N4UH44_9RHOB|nr:histidine phosphatase family protein [Pacificibacter maritimus]RPE66581.1 putative phosphoglycerate mutase [Pacificibacter maritimus]